MYLLKISYRASAASQAATSVPPPLQKQRTEWEEPIDEVPQLDEGLGYRQGAYTTFTDPYNSYNAADDYFNEEEENQYLAQQPTLQKPPLDLDNNTRGNGNRESLELSSAEVYTLTLL